MPDNLIATEPRSTKLIAGLEIQFDFFYSNFLLRSKIAAMPAKLMHSHYLKFGEKKELWEVEKKVENHEQSFFFGYAKNITFQFVASSWRERESVREKNVSEFILNFCNFYFFLRKIIFNFKRRFWTEGLSLLISWCSLIVALMELFTLELPNCKARFGNIALPKMAKV